jgi:NTE family protein
MFDLSRAAALIRQGCFLPALLLAFLALGGCATRPANPPITQADPHAGYRLATRQAG